MLISFKTQKIMKQTYLKPVTDIVTVDSNHGLLAGTLGTPGEGYSESDITYSRRERNTVWEDENEEEY